MGIHDQQMLARTEEVAQLCDTEISQGKVVNVMEIQFRTETNKLCNTSTEMKDNESTDKERTLTELEAFNNYSSD